MIFPENEIWHVIDNLTGAASPLGSRIECIEWCNARGKTIVKVDIERRVFFCN